MSGDVVPENSHCVSNCLVARFGVHFHPWILSRCISGIASMYVTAILKEIKDSS